MSTGEGGGCVRKKRSTDDGDGENGPRKRYRIAAASTVDNGQTGDDTGHYIINADEIDDNGDCTGEDLIYYYSDDDAETEVDDANAVEPAEQRYIVLSQVDYDDSFLKPKKILLSSGENRPAQERNVRQ